MVKNSLASGRRRKTCGFDLWVRKIPGGGHGNPPQCSCLENPMDRGVWHAAVHGVANSRAWLKQLNTHVHSTVTHFLDCSIV